MTEQFKTTAEYRHWMARHDLEEIPFSLNRTIADLLPLDERWHWGKVCDRYEARDFPDWFIKEVGELNDY